MPKPLAIDIDPDTRIRPISQWGKECARGFVRDARFGPGQVIKGTNRNKTRKNRTFVDPSPKLKF